MKENISELKNGGISIYAELSKREFISLKKIYGGCDIESVQSLIGELKWVNDERNFMSKIIGKIIFDNSDDKTIEDVREWVDERLHSKNYYGKKGVEKIIKEMCSDFNKERVCLICGNIIKSKKLDNYNG